MDDRLLTEAEYNEFQKTIRELREQEAIDGIAELLALQTKKLKDQAIYIQVLEDLAESKREKIEKLEETLTVLEQEVMKLR